MNAPAINSPVGFVVRLLESWNRFWFSRADPTTLGLIRIVAGFTVLYVHLAYSYDLQTFFGPNAWIDSPTMEEFRKEQPLLAPPSGWNEPKLDPVSSLGNEERDYIEKYKLKWGVDPRLAIAKGHRQFWSIWYHVTDATWMWIVHGSILVFMFLFAIGFCTRIMGILAWAGMLSYLNRAPTVLFGMDTIMIVVVLYLMVGPSGAALSIDRLIKRWWLTYRAGREHHSLPDLSRPERSVSANLALRLLQVHVCIIYLVSGTTKLQGGVWWGGTAVWATMANYEFSPMQYQFYMNFLQILSEHRWLWELFVTGGTYFTLIFEISFIFLVWNRRLRWTMLVAAVILHLGIALCMGLVTFSMMMMTCVLAFVPAEAVRRLIAQLSRVWLSFQPAPQPSLQTAHLMSR